MGNLCTCFAPKTVKKRRPAKRLHNPHPGPSSGSNRWNRIRSSRKDKLNDSLVQEQALAAAILFSQRQQQNGGSSLPFDRSASLRYPNSGSKKTQLPRSSSSRARSLTDPLLQPHQLVNQVRFSLLVLIFERSGMLITCCYFCWFLVSFFQCFSRVSFELVHISASINLQVILVGHDFGGACISYAMELFPSKIAKAIFIAAAMLTSGQNTLDMFSQQAGSNDLMQQAQIFLYVNGNDHPPTAIDLDKTLLRDLLFNQSPAKDVALASVSMRLIPFAPVLEKLSLSEMKYGSVRRFYIETPEDNAIPISLQESMVKARPPEVVFRIKGADHSPFFSKPQALHKLLVEISKIAPT
ncbi:putative methylesterase 11, chloroplastic [Carica papaya]|uniref:putative methylesterase 11, chloroplastic n=1 Tax=Carica papaya TaxID=3649 RepID=UPI000B8C703B|nr:putative methylesterase 11, chloroplastic [Carica papaya]